MYQCPNCGSSHIFAGAPNQRDSKCITCGYLDNTEAFYSDKKAHPLLNTESSHYALLGGIEAIEVLEAMFSKEELMAWAKLNWFKYKLRLGQKDAIEKELKKMETYAAYYEYLKGEE